MTEHPTHHLNQPMVNRLRACADHDTTDGSWGQVTIHTPEAAQLVALIDYADAIASEADLTGVIPTDACRLMDAAAEAEEAEPDDNPLAQADARYERIACRTDPHATIAQALYSLADTIAAGHLPLPRYTLTISACLPTREAVRVWADHYGTTIVAGGTDQDIPVAATSIPAGDLDVKIRVQGPADSRPEVERLREQVAELRAQLHATGGHL